MPTLRQLRDRVKSLKNTQQITRAMKMVAGARIRRAELAMRAARPYAVGIGEMLRELGSAGGSDHVTVNPSIYGLTTIPLAKNKNAGVLGGGTLAAVRPKVNKSQLAAAMKWISFFYEQPLVSKSAAIRNAKTLVANHQPVGVPALPLFNKKQYNRANKWIKPYINVPLGQMKPFLNGIFKQKLIPEPEASTQSVYNALNSVVEAVLTNQGTNIPQMLQQANAQAQASIKAGS